MNSPAEQMTSGAHHRRFFLYSPGAMNPHTWYRIHGEAMKMAERIGSFTHTILNASMGVIRVSFGSLRPKLRTASTAAGLTRFPSSLAKGTLLLHSMRTPA